ncbi:hypothetical protein TSAR_015151 [Trichomalopsis sarcophagae]|uniref:Peptidase S1 domain-containing protein n=1 Tax=Trichomalopsis sarcophagae TaxID=543379 RepID=A0A232FEU3_9HYME|nr:hypothetical protein TSAR_015151 [Trichomalopsis sarcophagae]
MKCLWLALFAVACGNCFSQQIDKYNKSRVVGGSYISIKETPHQAQIISEDDTVCGASIISEYWLVSAAHCFVGNQEELTITTGSSYSFSGERHEIEKFIVHPKYSWHNHNDHDISLIKVKRPIEFNERQRSISLASEPPRVGDRMKISGYGWESLRKKRKLRQQLRRLKSVELKVVNQRTCARRYTEIYAVVTANSFCARGGSEFGACTADSGGPGIINGKLAGIVSAGYECNTSYYPGIFTRVDLYRKWIEKETGSRML